MELGPYEVTGEVGRGGMGTVLRGRAPDGRAVAIKLLLKPGARDALERFRREGRLQGALGEGEGFVPLLDSGVGPRGPYLVMPFLEGGTLRARLQRGPLSIEETLSLGRALAAALGRAHARGVVHRDLKPENVLFTADGRALVADLGLAKHFDPEAAGAGMSVQLSKTGELRGTVGYAAPEQLRDAKTAGPPADVFALGAILYECLAGRAPFEGQSMAECFALTLAGDVEPLRRLRRDAPPWLVAAIEGALAREPGARFADGAALADALAGASGGSSRAPLVLAAAVVTLAALGGVIAVAARRDDVPSAPAPPAPAPAPVEPVVQAPPEAPPPDYPLETATLRRATVIGSPAWKVFDGVHAAAPTRDRARALLGLQDGTVQLFDLSRGEVLWTGLDGAPIYTAAVSPDDALGASGNTSGEVRLWDLASGRQTGLTALGSSVTRVAFAPNGRHLAACCDDGTLRVLDLSRGSRVTLNVREGEGAPGGLAWSPDGQVIFTGGRDGRLRAWWAGTGELAGEVAAHGAIVMTLAHAAAAPRLVTGAWDGTLVVWDVVREEGRVRLEPAQRLRGHDDHVRAAAITPDGRRVASGGADDRLRVWDVADGEEVATFVGRRFVAAVVLSDDGERVWGAGWDGRLRAWDVASSASLDAVQGHGGPVFGVALLPGGQAASGGWDDTVRVWDLGAAREVRQVRHAGGTYGFSVSDDGARVMSGSSEGDAVLFDLRSGAEVTRFAPRGGWVLSCALSPDGTLAATGSSDGSVRLWQVAGSSEPVLFRGHAGDVTAVTFAGNGAVISGGADGTVRFWDLSGMIGNTVLSASSGPQVKALARMTAGRLLVADQAGAITLREPGGGPTRTFGHERPVRAVVVTPDGALAASAGEDGAVRLWDVATGRERDRIDLAPRLDRPTSLALSVDGRELLVGTGRGVILRYVVR